MPNPHFDISITQRSKGKSAVAGAAYQSAENLFSEYDQKAKNYTYKKGVVYTEIMLPANQLNRPHFRQKLRKCQPNRLRLQSRQLQIQLPDKVMIIKARRILR